MDHTPFIWTAYGLTAVVLAWTALAPVLRRRRVLEAVRQVARHAPRPGHRMEHDDDANT